MYCLSESRDIPINGTNVTPRGVEKNHSPRVGEHSPPSLLALKLPTDVDQWREVDVYIMHEVVPLVLGSTSPEQKHLALVQGIYRYLSSRFGTKSLKATNQQVKQKRHDRELKMVTNLKNEARKKVRAAKKDNKPPGVVAALTGSFLSLLRQHSRLKQLSIKSLYTRNTKEIRQRCHKNFWKFAKDLLDDDSVSQVQPQFSRDQATTHFTETYTSNPKVFNCPKWMPTPSLPSYPFMDDPIRRQEIERAIKAAKSSSSPSPYDQISYTIMKKCPSIVSALLDLFTTCWSLRSVPPQWKTAAVKLIGKTSAIDDPSSPNNFRPIALTPTVGKIFTTILKQRMLDYMISNNYMDKTIQKAFLPATSGCVEHHVKLAAVISSARKSHRSLAIAWLDIANAYGSVHHSLIQFALSHYHLPVEFSQMVQSLYSGLSASVISHEWSTPLIPILTGVYQGDPLSVVIFNTVINTLIDTLKTKSELGFNLPNSSHKLNLLQFADDSCLIAKDSSACQSLLRVVEKWLLWAGMKAKVPKCHSVAIEASTGKPIDPHLKLDGKEIPFLGQTSIKFLGLSISIPRNTNDIRRNLVSLLDKMLKTIDNIPVTRKQKLRLFTDGVCPRLSWLLLTEEFPLSWIETQVQPIATRFIKRWAGLTKSANTALLFLSRSEGGLQIPSITGVYQRLQVSRYAQLITSSDSCVRSIVESKLRKEDAAHRMKFRPVVEVRNSLCEDPSMNRKQIVKRVKAKVTEQVNNTEKNRLTSLPQQGQMSRAANGENAKIWSQAVTSLPDRIMKFAINASLDSLPTNANLHKWKKLTSPQCSLCQSSNQSLHHILNQCPVALKLRRYNKRHDNVLQVINSWIKEHAPPTANVTADLPNTSYDFPTHITPCSERPDIIWWDETQKLIHIIELTIPFESNTDKAVKRKEGKYLDLLKPASENGYWSTLTTLEVGSRGLVNEAGFKTLKKLLNPTRKKFTTLLQQCSRQAIIGSFAIWCSRNSTNP